MGPTMRRTTLIQRSRCASGVAGPAVTSETTACELRNVVAPRLLHRIAAPAPTAGTSGRRTTPPGGRGAGWSGGIGRGGTTGVTGVTDAGLDARARSVRHGRGVVAAEIDTEGSARLPKMDQTDGAPTRNHTAITLSKTMHPNDDVDMKGQIGLP